MELTKNTKCNLEILAEEAAEVIQAKSKIIRFGLDDYHPKNKVINKVKLGQEIGHFLTMVGKLLDDGTIDIRDIIKGEQEKSDNLETWFCYGLNPEK